MAGEEDAREDGRSTCHNSKSKGQITSFNIVISTDLCWHKYDNNCHDVMLCISSVMGSLIFDFHFQVVRVNRQFNVIYVRGAVPGHTNTYVRVTDARRKVHETPPPFPTYFPETDDEGAEPSREWEEFSSVRLPDDGSLDFPNRYANKD